MARPHAFTGDNWALPKTISVGLEHSPLSEDELEELLVELEKHIRRGIENRVKRRLDELEIVITADLKKQGRELDLAVDVKATGRVIAPLSYDEIIAEAIDEAVAWLAKRLRERGAKRGSEETN